MAACGGTSWPTIRRLDSSTIITSISTPGARKVSCRAVSSLRTPASSVAESKTSSASSWSMVRHVEAARAASIDVLGNGVRHAQRPPEQLEQFVVVPSHDSSSLGSTPAGNSRRNRSRQRARVGPMLPIGRPSMSAMVW